MPTKDAARDQDWDDYMNKMWQVYETHAEQVRDPPQCCYRNNLHRPWPS